MFGFFLDYNAYIQVISYDKVLEDAIKKIKFFSMNYNYHIDRIFLKILSPSCFFKDGSFEFD